MYVLLFFLDQLIVFEGIPEDIRVPMNTNREVEGDECEETRL